MYSILILCLLPGVISDAQCRDGLVSGIRGLWVEQSHLQPGLYPGTVDHSEPQVGCLIVATFTWTITLWMLIYTMNMTIIGSWCSYGLCSIEHSSIPIVGCASTHNENNESTLYSSLCTLLVVMSFMKQSRRPAIYIIVLTLFSAIQAFSIFISLKISSFAHITPILHMLPLLTYTYCVLF